MGGTLQYPKLKLRYRILYWLSLIRLWLVSWFKDPVVNFDLRFITVEIIVKEKVITIFAGNNSMEIELTEDYSLFNFYDDLFKFLTQLYQSIPVETEKLTFISNEIKVLAYMRAQYGYMLSYDKDTSKSLSIDVILNRNNYRRLSFSYGRKINT